MTLIDDKKVNATDILIKIKKFLINISISLAVYILLFIIGSLTMFSCNVSEAKILDKICPDDVNISLQKIEIPINVISDNNMINKYFNNKYIDENENSASVSHEEIARGFRLFLNRDENKDRNEIFQILESNKSNAEKLLFCVDENENKNFGIFKNSVKYTINFIYSLINLYSTFLNNYMAEIFILWVSPLFSFLYFIFLILISGAYFYYKIIYISVVNIFQKVFTNFFNESWLLKLQQILISSIIILVTIILTIFGFLFIPIISFIVVIYTIFNILTQKLRKKETDIAITGDGDYGIFQKMADNLIYKKGYNIILILILSIINVFLFDSSIGGIILGLIIIFYFIFYNKLNLNNIPFRNFHHNLIQKNQTVELG
jgi:hypothetical protein